MATFKVIALSCGAKNRILEAGEFVTEDAFEDGESEAREKVKEGFLKEVDSKEAPKAAPVKEAKEEKKSGLLGKLSASIK